MKRRSGEGWMKRKPSRRLRRHIIKPIREFIRGAVLDVGCREGIQLSTFENGVGVDLSLASLKVAKEKGLRVVLADAHNLPFRDNRFNTVFCSQVIEHLPDPGTALTEFRRVLKRGGHLLIEFPNVNSKIDRGWDKEVHVQFFSPKSLSKLVKKCGFDVVRVIPSSFLIGKNWVLDKIWMKFSGLIAPWWGNLWVIARKP